MRTGEGCGKKPWGFFAGDAITQHRQGHLNNRTYCLPGLTLDVRSLGVGTVGSPCEPRRKDVFQAISLAYR